MKKLFGLFLCFITLFLGSAFAGTLQNFSYSGTTDFPGATGSYSFAYTTENILTGGETSIFMTSFPGGGFGCTTNINDLTVTINGSGVTPDGLTVFDSNCTVIIRLTETVNPGSNVFVSIANVTNPVRQGTFFFGYGPVTTLIGGQIIDQPNSVSPITIVLPAGVLPYRANIQTPPGFVQIIDNINNPQWMVYMRQTPYVNGGPGYSYEDMLGFGLSENEAIPTTALKNLLVSSNGTTTWVASGNTMNNPDGRADWLSDPQDAGDEEYNLMGTVGGTHFQDMVDSFSYIRTIYTRYPRVGCVNYGSANYIGAVVLESDGTVIGCNEPATGDNDIIPGANWGDWVSEFEDDWDEFTARLGFACDDCWMAYDGEEGDVGFLIGFDINYYGTVYDRVFVNSNGSLSFGAGADEYDEPLAEVLEGLAGICAYCLDLENDEQIEELIESDSGRNLDGNVRNPDFVYRGRTIFEGRPAFVGTWINMSTHGDQNLNTFQIILVDTSNANNDVTIIVNYGSILNQDQEGYCLEGEGQDCARVAIGLSVSSGDFVIYNSIVDDNGTVLDGMQSIDLWDGADTPLNTRTLNSTIPGRFIFNMVGGVLPNSTHTDPEYVTPEVVPPEEIHPEPSRRGGRELDNCPNGDNSGSYYDGKCDGTNPQVHSSPELPKLKINQIEKKDPIKFCKENDSNGGSIAFADIVGTTYETAVDMMVKHCLVQGYNNDGQEFGINNSLKRGEFYKVFTKMGLLDFDLNTPGLGWSYGYKTAGATVGLWAGIMDKDQSAPVTQQELLQVTMNYLKHMGVLDESPTLGGKSLGVTRGEFAKFINTVLGLVSTR